MWIVFLKVWCRMYWWYLGLVIRWYMVSIRLLVISELVVEKKLRLCMMMCCLFLLRLFLFFYRVMLVFMLIFCGI